MFNFDDLDRTIRELVTASPDHVYPRRSNGPRSCFYLATTRNSPGACLFGQAFAILGVTPEHMSAHEGYTASGMLDSWEDFDGELSPTQVRWIRVLQTRQDSQLTWARALEDADRAKALLEARLAV